jgi:peptidoglycan/LPS O-acetylase OafA/YrhL
VAAKSPAYTATQRIPGLDCVRAAAILLVLLAHASLLTAETWPSTAILSAGGLTGVETFFALSGFLVGGILYRSHIAGTLSVASFWRRRWLRTIPAYLLFLALNAVFQDRVNHTLTHDWRYLLHVQNLNWQHPAFFSEAWSLALEEWFYLLAPVLIIGLTFVLPRRLAFLAMACVLIVGPLIYRLVLVATADPSWDLGVRKVVLPRLDAIGLGVLVAFCHHEDWFASRTRRAALALTGAVLLMLSVAVYLAAAVGGWLDHSYFTRTWLLFFCPLGGALTLPWFAHMRRLPGRLFSAGVRALATISYSAYLCNLLVFQSITARAEPGGVSSAWQAGLFLSVTVVVATVSYLAVERPFMRLGRGQQSEGRVSQTMTNRPSTGCQQP